MGKTCLCMYLTDRQYLSLDGRWVPSTVDIYVEEIQLVARTYNFLAFKSFSSVSLLMHISDVSSAFDTNPRLVFRKGSLTYELAIVDTPGDGDGDYERLRPLSYTQADVFLVCFSVASPSTFDAVPEKWIPEVRHHYPDATIILVGTHVDERVETPPEVDAAEHERKFITKEDGERMAKRVGAKKYVECNATHTAGLKAILYEVVFIG